GVRLTTAELERFLQEARAAATIRHPNICPIYDVGMEGNLPYIIMSFVPDGTLANLIVRRRASFSPQDAVTIARKLAMGLVAAHAKNVSHRDLKPQNVLWDEASREVLITDFGLARIGGGAQRTREGQMLGTVGYMAPEQAHGKQAVVGPLSDVYALGVILYQLLTGRLPFQGSEVEILAQAQFAEPQPPSAVRPGLDPRLDSLCLRALANKPEDRYPSGKALAEALGDYRRGVVGVELVQTPAGREDGNWELVEPPFA